MSTWPESSLPSSADVVVVGARAAGASTAMLLARAGLTVVLLDRERPGADTLSTHALMRGGVLQLSRWGILDEIVAAGTPAICEATFHTREVARFAIKPSDGVDALYAPRRTVLDPVLVTNAARAGAVVRHRVHVTGLHRDRRGRVAGVHLHDATGTPGRIVARLVVGADGRHSKVAGWVDAPVTHAVHHSSAFTYGYWAELDAVGYEWAYRPGAMAGFVPTNDGLTCVFAGDVPERIGRGGPAVLQATVARASASMAARLAVARPASIVRTFTGQPGRLRRPGGAGWALVGDAGSWKDPITAHGLTDALRDAELLARAVVASWGDDGLMPYEEARDRLTVPILTAGDEIAAMCWDDDRIDDLLRTLSAAMSDEVHELEALTALPGSNRARDAGRP